MLVRRVALGAVVSLALPLALAAAAVGQQERAAYKFKVIARGFEEPTHVAVAPGEPNILYVVERRGRIRVLVRGVLRAKPFLDLRRRVTIDTEQGLLSMAFHPRYARNGRFYVYYTDVRGAIRIVEYRGPSGRSQPSAIRGRTTTAASSRSAPTSSSTSGSGTAAVKATRTTTPNGSGTPTGSSSASTSTGVTRGLVWSASDCATRGASRSIVARATSTSATSARAPGRRSTTPSGGAQGSAGPGSRTTDGRPTKARPATRTSSRTRQECSSIPCTCMGVRAEPP